MVRHLVARYAGGENTDPYYQHNQRYPLAIKTRLFSKKVSIYKRQGYINRCQPGTERDFRDMRSFLTLFKPVPDKEI